jgi:hypothetical protein
MLSRSRLALFLSPGTLVALLSSATAFAEPPPTWQEGDSAAATPPPPQAPSGPPQGALAPTSYEVEDHDPPEQGVSTKMASPALFGIGIGLSSLGFLGGVTGLGLFKSNDKEYCVDDCVTQRDAGLGLAIGGGVLLVVGIPMMLIGARQVPAPAWAKAMPTHISMGPRGGTLGWTF